MLDGLGEYAKRQEVSELKCIPSLLGFSMRRPLRSLRRRGRVHRGSDEPTKNLQSKSFNLGHSGPSSSRQPSLFGRPCWPITRRRRARRRGVSCRDEASLSDDVAFCFLPPRQHTPTSSRLSPRIPAHAEEHNIKGTLTSRTAELLSGSAPFSTPLALTML